MRRHLFSPERSPGPEWFSAAVLISVIGGASIAADFIGSTEAAVVRGLAGLLAAGALGVGARRRRCSPQWAWTVLALGVAVWVLGDGLWDALTITDKAADSGWYTVANVLYLVTYPALFAAVLGLVGGGIRGSFDDVIDSVIVALAAVLVMRMFIIDNTPTSSSLDALYNAAYPLGDALLLGAVAWLVFTTGAKSVPAWLLASGMALMLLTDIMWDLQYRYALGSFEAWTNPAYPIAYAVIAATALHPAAARLAERRVERTRYIHRTRLGFLCGSVAVLSMVAVVDTTRDPLVQVVTAVLVAAIAIRFGVLVRATERAYRQADRNERRFRLLATAVPVGILESTLDPQIVFANEEADHLFGTSVVGYDLVRLSSLVSESAEDDERRLTREGIQQVIAGERASAQLRIRGVDGQERWVAWYGMPSGERGQHTGAFIAAVDITALKDAESMLALQATHDALTGLPNRRLLFDRLSRALNRLVREPGAVAVLFMDLDRFKPVNDRFGHDAGDKLLQVIAGRLQGAVRAGDTVARVGGDEFVVVLDPVSSRDDVVRIAAKIVEVVGEPVDLDDGPASVGASIGIAFSRNAQDDPDTLLRDADAAMYLAKSDDGAGFRFFDAEIGDHETARSLVGKRHHVSVPRRAKTTS